MEKTNFDKLIKNIQASTNSIDSRNNRAYLEHLQDSFTIEKREVYVDKETKEKIFIKPDNMSDYEEIYEEIYIPKYITIYNPMNNTFINIPKYSFSNNRLQTFDEATINIKTEPDEIKHEKIKHIKKHANTIKNMILYPNYKNIGINEIITKIINCDEVPKCEKCKEIELLISYVKDIILYVECKPCIILCKLIENVVNGNIVYKKDNNSLDVELKVKAVNTLGCDRITAFLQ